MKGVILTMLVNGQRALAYVTTLEETKPIEGYDRVEYGRVGGWWCIINKADNMKVGDKVIYFEIDSRVPSTDERFAFLEKRHYKVKTLKMCKVISQGLIMPITLFPELQQLDVGSDVTKQLGIVYADDPLQNQSVPSGTAHKIQAFLRAGSTAGH